MSETKPRPSSRKQIEALDSEARRARRAYDLFKAEADSDRTSDVERLRELKRQSEIAQMRLIRARADA